MLRRLATPVLCTAINTARRMYTPPEELKKLYATDFTGGQFPVDVVPSDSATFAKFLFKAAEAKNNHDAIIKDFATIQTAVSQLEVFWERTLKVDDIKGLQGLQPATLFTLHWMHANKMLEQLKAVEEIFNILTNGLKKKVVAVIYLPGPEKSFSSEAAQAKEAAKKLHASTKEFTGTSLDFVFRVDPEFISGFAVDVRGAYISNAKGRGRKEAATAEVDYTNVPQHVPIATKWEENVETEVLRKYLEGMSKYDFEEQVNGV